MIVGLKNLLFFFEIFGALLKLKKKSEFVNEAHNKCFFYVGAEIYKEKRIFIIEKPKKEKTVKRSVWVGAICAPRYFTGATVRACHTVAV